jgi:hypothetical protein
VTTEFLLLSQLTLELQIAAVPWELAGEDVQLMKARCSATTNHKRIARTPCRNHV